MGQSGGGGVSGLIFRLLRALLKFNARIYGRGASFEVCRDLQGEFRS